MTRSRRTKSPKKAYHHGDLRQALLQAGLAIVEKEGLSELTLREVARRAKVSHSAPYHHFENRAELLAAVAAAAFQRMGEEIDRQVQHRKPATGLDALRCVGLGYMTFAANNPGAFRLMFRPELTRPADHPLLQQAESETFGRLLEVIQLCQRTGELAGQNPLPPAAAAWSAVHGLCVLHVEQVLLETPLGKLPFEQLAEMINEMAVSGVKAMPAM